MSTGSGTAEVGILTIRLGEFKPSRATLASYLRKRTEVGCWPKFMRRVIDGTFVVTPKTKEVLHGLWTEVGRHVRGQIDDDRELVKFLRLALPPYGGTSVLLYRGENKERWIDRRVGLCWTTNLETARMFGRGVNATDGGGVLLRCHADAASVIAGPSPHSLYLGEGEYTVDPALLVGMEAIEEFPPID